MNIQLLLQLVMKKMLILLIYFFNMDTKMFNIKTMMNKKQDMIIWKMNKEKK